MTKEGKEMEEIRMVKAEEIDSIEMTQEREGESIIIIIKKETSLEAEVNNIRNELT